MPTLITKDNYENEVLKSEKPVIVDVYAEWCGPCQNMNPIFEKLEKELSDYKFVKLNVDESRELAIQFGVSTIPTFVFIKNGEVKGKKSGERSEEQFKEEITSILG